jgi:pimeloyl-ACP methyl ester carboxylesterase
MNTSGSVRIAYEDLGAGDPALLLLPGWCADRAVFEELAQRLSVRHRVLALDWRGHGDSDRPSEDFGSEQLVQDALAVIEDAGAGQVIPVSLSHGGWVAVELRRRLGARVPKLVATEWLMLEPPARLLELLRGLQSPAQWRQTVLQLFSVWLKDSSDMAAVRFVYDRMGAYGYDMWARAAREIREGYRREGTPLRALARLDEPPQVLHLYGQPADPAYLEAQLEFAARHPWFHVTRMPARGHFSMIEMPGDVARVIEDFVEF